MNFTRIIAVAAFAFHILVGCGLHQHGAVASNGDDQRCSSISHGTCHAATEPLPDEQHSPLENPDDCEVASCVYVGVQQVEVSSPIDAATLIIMPPVHEFGLITCSGQGFNTGELRFPHVRRHLELRHLLN